MSGPPPDPEAQRLALSTAEAYSAKAYDALAEIPASILTTAERLAFCQARDAMMRLHGSLAARRAKMVVEEQRRAEAPLPGCPCYRCDGSPALRERMYLCGQCGGKMCPRATDCRLACTGSNEPGQRGSAYE